MIDSSEFGLRFQDPTLISLFKNLLLWKIIFHTWIRECINTDSNHSEKVSKPYFNVSFNCHTAPPTSDLVKAKKIVYLYFKMILYDTYMTRVTVTSVVFYLLTEDT